MKPIHDQVDPIVGAYLEASDREAPRLVEGLYLTGSVALNEFRPGTSDIDFLAVTAQPPDASALIALARAHEELRQRFRRPFFDGRYVTWDELACDPRQAGPGPYVYQGRFRASGGGDCDPVTWHTVAEYGVCCRGPEPSALTIWNDGAALKSWTLGNYDTYWRPLLRRARRFGDPWSLTAFTSYGAVWIVLGVCRLHFTLATGRIVSKEGSGEYGLQTFPSRWHLVLREALRIRRADRARADLPSAVAEMLGELSRRSNADGGSLYRTPITRRRDVLAFADMVIGDAISRFGSTR